MTKTQQTSAATSEATNIKETIESILIAFVLAFMFRAFVVEAFVIPTGSMAPTLLGAHMQFRCQQCAYEFTVNFSPSQRGGEDLSVPQQAIDPKGNKKIYTIICPNCGFKQPKEKATAPDVHYGDRILVLKYLYLFHEPERWDVVVFKSPASPEIYDYTQNYIKRLIGRPNERVMLLDGDVYARRLATDNWVVQPKPKVVQDALWRVVYDNDHHPQQALSMSTEWKQPWIERQGTEGWTTNPKSPGTRGGRVFRFDNLTGAGTLFFDPLANHNANHFTDFLAYDITQSQAFDNSPTDTFANFRPGISYTNVSDLRVTMFHERSEGDGPLRLKLSKRGVTFIAELTPTQVRLLRSDGIGEERQIYSQEISLPPGKAARIDFANVDYRVSLRIDEKLILQTTPADYSPEVDSLKQEHDRTGDRPLPTVEIEARNHKCLIDHLSLWRDVYYISRGSSGGELFWGHPDREIILGPGEYFVLGDNSPISGDARYWNEPINLPSESLFVEPGRVPERFMLGKAFFVYWPAGYRLLNTISLIPNFGQMRFIH